MLEKFIEVDQLRNSALSLAWGDASKSSENAESQLEEMAKKVSDPTVLFNNEVAEKMANKQVELGGGGGGAAKMGSVYGTLQSAEKELIEFPRCDKIREDSEEGHLL